MGQKEKWGSAVSTVWSTNFVEHESFHQPIKCLRCMIFVPRGLKREAIGTALLRQVSTTRTSRLIAINTTSSSRWWHPERRGGGEKISSWDNLKHLKTYGIRMVRLSPQDQVCRWPKTFRRRKRRQRELASAWFFPIGHGLMNSRCMCLSKTNPHILRV